MVNYKDVFDMTWLYTLAHEWLIEEGWAKRNADPEFPEIYYLQRETPGFGKEIWIRWRLTKHPEAIPKGKDGSALFLFEMDVEFHVLGLKNTEVIVKGQKFKTNKGEVEVRVNAGLVVDHRKYFEQNPLLKPFKDLWIKRIIQPRLRSLQGELQSQAYRFREAINTYLQLEKLFESTEFAEFWSKKSME